ASMSPLKTSYAGWHEGKTRRQSPSGRFRVSQPTFAEASVRGGLAPISALRRSKRPAHTPVGPAAVITLSAELAVPIEKSASRRSILKFQDEFADHHMLVAAQVVPRHAVAPDVLDTEIDERHRVPDQVGANQGEVLVARARLSRADKVALNIGMVP